MCTVVNRTVKIKGYSVIVNEDAATCNSYDDDRDVKHGIFHFTSKNREKVITNQKRNYYVCCH